MNSNELHSFSISKLDPRETRPQGLKRCQKMSRFLAFAGSLAERLAAVAIASLVIPRL